jgi:hypothetical protein
MILSLLTALGGGLLRMMPELFAFLNRKQDNAHELALMQHQIELAKLQGDIAHEATVTQGEIDQALKMLDATTSALAGQMQKTGFWLVDGMNFLVRPLTTYLLLAMYAAHKLGGAMLLYGTNNSLAATFVTIYTPEDFALLTGILSFWFVGRSFDKQKGA